MADATGARQNLERRARTTHQRAVARTLKDLQDAAPVDTGQLRRSVRTANAAGATGLLAAQVEVNPPRTPSTPDNVAVAGFNEYGTRAHVITPKRAKVLAFESGGQTRFARIVHHPGQRARPWFYPVLDRWSQAIQQAWRSAP